MSDRRVLLPENVWCFDGTFECAALAVERAGGNPPLIVIEAGNTSEETLVGQARSAQVDSELIIFPSRLGSLGRAAMADFARQLTAQHDPGLVMAILEEIERASRNFVITGKPGSLKRPNPKLWQHLLGFLPSRTALGELDGSVRIIGPKGLPDDTRREYALPNMVLHSTAPQANAEACRRVLSEFSQAASAAQHITHPRLTETQAEWWGPRDAVEIVAVPADISPITASVKHRARTCSWCGLSTVTPVCGFCRADGEAPRSTSRPKPEGQYA
ncbi:hypothetical protein HMPREF3172_02465 [Brevibacterium sp. HMSC08F02]|uniref:hypothetical protein n=1 Tax=Brevibacterium sp. HMSC08F02 TaxID=1581140 RepID=UPI0008A54282|nr:hypothetical protein [Brevibacterium sp. HMSC08F02]OFT26714.1 hypothetical protein HMPREF3172_02465 [Brevibacterium sp. HMSC08F02]